jgi:hypothetical protein
MAWAVVVVALGKLLAHSRSKTWSVPGWELVIPSCPRYVSTGGVGFVNGNAPAVESSGRCPLMPAEGVAPVPGIPAVSHVVK